MSTRQVLDEQREQKVMAEAVTRRRMLRGLVAGVVGVLAGARTMVANAAEEGPFEAASRVLSKWGFTFGHTSDENGGEVVTTEVDARAGVRYDTVIGEDLSEGVEPCWLVGFKDGDSETRIGAGGSLLADLEVVEADSALTYRLLDEVADGAEPCWVVASTHDQGSLASLAATSLISGEQPQWVMGANYSAGTLADFKIASLAEIDQPCWLAEATMSEGALAALTATSFTDITQPCWVTESVFGAGGLTGFKATALAEDQQPCWVAETVELDGTPTIRASVLDPPGTVIPCFVLDSQSLAAGQRIRAVVAPDVDFEIGVIDGPTYRLDGGMLVEVEQTAVVEPA